TSATAWVNGSQITWNWSVFPDNASGTVSYDMRVGTVPGGSDILAGPMVTALSFTLQNATEGRPYYLSLRGRDGVGNVGAWGTPSDAVSVDLAPPPAPAAPSGPAGYMNVTSADWTWPAVTDSRSGLDHYELVAGSMPGGDDLAPLSRLHTSSFAMTAMPEGVDVYITVRAVDVAGNVGAWSPSSSRLVADRSPPATTGFLSPPSGWTNSSALSWEWAPATDPVSGLAGYLVRVGRAPGMDDLVAEALQTVTTVGIACAPEGGSIYVTVRPVDFAGNIGEPSASPAVLVDLTGPDAPAFGPTPLTPTNSATITW